MLTKAVNSFVDVRAAQSFCRCQPGCLSPGRMTQGHTLVCGPAATTHSQCRLPKKRRRGRSEQSPRVQCTDSYAKATVKKKFLLSFLFLCNNISLVQGPSGQRPSNWGLWLHGASEFIIENVSASQGIGIALFFLSIWISNRSETDLKPTRNRPDEYIYISIHLIYIYIYIYTYLY